MKSFIFSLLFVLSAGAAEVKIARIVSDTDTEIGDLFVEIVDGKVDSMRIYKTKGQQVTDDHTYPLETIIADNGILATERMGYPVVRLKLKNISAHNGGVVVIDYL